MGDGDIHSSEADIQYIQCKTCHGTPTQLPLTKTLTDPNDIAFRQALLNPVVDLQLGDTVIVTDKGEAMWNTACCMMETINSSVKPPVRYSRFDP